MGRIPAGELEKLKSEVDLVALIQSQGVELKKHGADLVGRCPFHNDKTPSLVVTPGKNLWHCMGACQMGGSVVDWVMKSRNVSFRHAVEILRTGDASVLLSSKKPPRTLNADRSLPSPVDASADDPAILGQVVEFYHQTLKTTPDALSYLAARGIESREAIDKFRLGYCDRTLSFRFKDPQTRSRLSQLGVIRATGHEHFAGSIVIPILGLDGQVTEIYGRKTQKCLTRAMARHFYLPGPHRGIWNPEGVRSGKGEVILCEALIDALSFWVNGFQNVTAAYGVEGFTADHLAAFIDSGIRRVLIAYDRDEAGDRAAEKLALKLAAEGMESWRVQFPKGMDANEYVRKVKPAAQALRVCLESAELLSKPKRLAAKSVAKATVDVAAPAASGLFSLAAVPPAASEATPVAQSAELPTLTVVPTPPSAPPKPPTFTTTTTAQEIPTEQRGEDWFVFLGDREYRVRGLTKNTTTEILRVNLRASFELRSHVDQLDLYQAKARAAFMHAASRGSGPRYGSHPPGSRARAAQVRGAARGGARKALKLAGGKERAHGRAPSDEKKEALAFFRAPDLLDRIVADFERCGVVGEEDEQARGVSRGGEPKAR